MRILNRYIGLAIAQSTLLVIAVLVSLFTFFTFADELNKTGKGSYQIADALQYAVATMPRTLYQLFPSAALLGAMLGLGGLASGSELVAMRSAGVSLRQIIWAVLKTGTLMMFVALVVGEVLAPWAERYAETARSLAMSDKITLQTHNGLWIRDGDSFINIGAIGSDGVLREISMYQLDNAHNLTRITRAKEALYLASEGWRMKAVDQIEIARGAVVSKSFTQKMWPSLVSPSLIDVVTVRPDSMSAWALWEYAAYLQKNGVDASKYVQAFWSKVVSPISVALMVVLAAPFVFGSLRSVSAGHRILVGVMVGIGFHLVSQIFGYVGLVYHLNPVLAATLPAGIFGLLAVVLVARVRG